MSNYLLCQDRETEPRFTGPPSRGDFGGAPRGGYGGGFGRGGGGAGGYGGGAMMGGGGGGGGGDGAGGRQLYISNVCCPPFPLLMYRVRLLTSL